MILVTFLGALKTDRQPLPFAPNRYRSTDRPSGAPPTIPYGFPLAPWDEGAAAAPNVCC